MTCYSERNQIIGVCCVIFFSHDQNSPVILLFSLAKRSIRLYHLLADVQRQHEICGKPVARAFEFTLTLLVFVRASRTPFLTCTDRVIPGLLIASKWIHRGPLVSSSLAPPNVRSFLLETTDVATRPRVNHFTNGRLVEYSVRELGNFTDECFADA